MAPPPSSSSSPFLSKRPSVSVCVCMFRTTKTDLHNSSKQPPRGWYVAVNGTLVPPLISGLQSGTPSAWGQINAKILIYRNNIFFPGKNKPKSGNDYVNKDAPASLIRSMQRRNFPGLDFFWERSRNLLLQHCI